MRGCNDEQRLDRYRNSIASPRAVQTRGRKPKAEIFLDRRKRGWEWLQYMNKKYAGNIKPEHQFDPFPKDGLTKQFEPFIRKEVEEYCQSYQHVPRPDMLGEAVRLSVAAEAKNATSGLRGASAWKASADVVEGVLANIDALSGETSNREVVSNKARDGVQGPLSPFNLEYVCLGLDQYGEDYGSCRVVPIDGSSRFAHTATSGKGDREFRDAFGEVLDGRSETITPRAGMAPVRAVRVTDVRGEFDRRYVTGRADKKEAADTKRKAFDRALNKLSPGEFGAAEIGGVEWVWRVQ